ncbi:MAG: hypothetical protein R3F37_20995 [Candidatus Competibacteraceae bacterium]
MLIGVLFMARNPRRSSMGLVAGGLIWYATLLMPLMQQAHIPKSTFNLMDFLNATEIRRMGIFDVLTLALQCLVGFAVSLITRHEPGEQRAIAACFGDQTFVPTRPGLGNATSPQQFSALGRIIGALQLRRKRLPKR